MSILLEVDFAHPNGFRPLSLDLRTPDAEGAPLVVFLHGGGWARGSRKVFTPGMSAADSFDRIVCAGVAVASCEYRLSGEARFPAQLDDVDAAIGWLRAHAAEHGVDPQRIVLWGVSAGATLAALAGLSRSDICGVVDWFGPTDLFAMEDQDPGGSGSDTREARWLGAMASQVPDIARRASPALRAHAGAPPFHIAHGSSDEHVPYSQSLALADALRGVGVEVDLLEVPGGRHFWQGLADTSPIVDRAIDFIHRTTAPRPTSPRGTQ